MSGSKFYAGGFLVGFGINLITDAAVWETILAATLITYAIQLISTKETS